MTSETSTSNSQYAVFGLEKFLRGREKDRRRERPTLETHLAKHHLFWLWSLPKLTHIIIITTKLYIPIPPSFFGYGWVLPSQTANSFHRSAEAEQHSGYRRGWERCVVYNWIGLLRNYTRLLLFTFLLTDWINCIVFCWRRWETIKLIYIGMCFVTKVKGQPSAPAVCLFHLNWSDVCQTYWSTTDLQKCLEQ